MAEADGAKNKLEEQARSKGDISYSYWISNTQAPANTDVQPVKLQQDASSMQQADAPGVSGQHTVSTWNKAGTFEERDVTEWAKQRLQDMLVGTSSGEVAVTKCRSITGNANIWFIRGKKRSGFDFALELEWQHSSTGSKGTLKVPSATPDDVDDLHCEVSIDSGSGDAAADEAARQAAKKLREPLQELLGQLIAELRSK